MNVRQSFFTFLLVGTMATSIVACKSKVSDADLQAKVETVLTNNPTVSADVKDGVITLNGTVTSEEEKAALENAVKSTEGKAIKSVVNNITVQQIEINTDTADLSAKVAEATKDFPSVQASVNDGVITVTGELEQARIVVLKQALDALNPKKVDMSAIQVK
jgi:hyperosmotically inducible protein